mgnify:CR=1 FL=1
MAKSNGWFDVDQKGLRQLQESRDKKFVPFELIQNGWDENITQFDINLERVGLNTVVVTAIDDSPEGFKDLTHSYTLFAPSAKKGYVNKRGRFNLGEKLVLSLCETATITTTKGQITFLKDGTRKHSKKCTTAGSHVVCELKMSAKEFKEMEAAIQMLLPPTNIITRVNGKEIKSPVPFHVFGTQLETMIAGDDGIMRPTKRNTTVELFKADDRPGMIYEMGIPVCETGDKFHVNVYQKVPLQMDRESVTDAFLRTVRTMIINETYQFLTVEDATSDWALQAAKDKRISDEAITKSLDLRFGEKRVSYDPTDPEANDTAQANGFTVVHGRTLSKPEWDNAKRAGAITSAGQMFPTSPNKVGCKPLDPSEWTDSMKLVAAYSEMLAKELMQITLDVSFVKAPKTVATLACYAHGETWGDLTFNITNLGMPFFDDVLESDPIESLVPVDDLLLHEFAHQYEASHKNAAGWDAITLLGAKLKQLALKKPEIFSRDYLSSL